MTREAHLPEPTEDQQPRRGLSGCAIAALVVLALLVIGFGVCVAILNGQL